MTPNQVTQDISTILTFSGDGVANGDMVAFLPAGSNDCAGALSNSLFAGGAVKEQQVQVRLVQPGIYKMCRAVITPMSDSAFKISTGVFLSVALATPPPPPLPPPPVLPAPETGLYSSEVAAIAIVSSFGGLIVAVMLISVACKRRRRYTSR